MTTTGSGAVSLKPADLGRREADRDQVLGPGRHHPDPLGRSVAAAVAAANRACDRDLPVVLGLAEGADVGDLRVATDRLNRAITELTRITDRTGSRRWAPTLDLGRVAVQQWESVTAGDPDAATYEQARRSGVGLVGRMRTELAELGAVRCAA